MIVGTTHGRRNPQFLGVHAYLLSIKRAAIREIITERLILSPLAYISELRPRIFVEGCDMTTRALTF
jgi:hypothetical protein